MAVIIENMEMPKCCNECPFLYDGGSCIINSDISDDALEVILREMTTRPSECPLQEVKEQICQK